MTDPLLITFEVGCPPELAFELWTARTGTWWPTTHTVSARPGVAVIIEPGAGGRIYERTPQGQEHEWGQVTGWDPPSRISYLWHLRQDRADATEVEITFAADPGAGTRISIIHRGWDALGARGPDQRELNQRGWSGLLGHFRAAAQGLSDDARLDHPVYAALTGAQSRFAQISGRAVRFQPDVAPFLALAPESSTDDWADAAELVPSGSYVGLQRAGLELPEGWDLVNEFDVLQMVEDNVDGIDDPEAITLGRADVPEMLKLVADTNPGPFLDRTIELGRYVGIRHQGELIAMAGERMHIDGWREISAICTAPAHRGHGLASRLLSTIACGIHRRSERAFLSVLSTNTTAIGLYEQHGFQIRASRTLSVITRR
jgi:uncharacterized protein YndB with AHSA1/START domain/GNAT superfamily N-acetyltransferase